jgi:protein-tyrosine phosphatase
MPIFTPADEVKVERQLTGEYTLDINLWAGGKPVKIHVAEDAQSLESSEFVIETDDSIVVLDDLNWHARHYFYLESADYSGVATERCIAMEGVHNFRDMGGYDTETGAKVRWGALYRSGKLSELSRRDTMLMDRLSLSLIYDFRRDDERERAPSRYSGSNAETINLAIIPGSGDSFFDRVVSGNADAEQMTKFMIELNVDLALNQTAQYQQMFAGLLLDNTNSVLIHCAAGKDRTGFGSALILAALGVSRSSVLIDYMLSNKYLPIEDEISNMLNTYADYFPSNIDRAILRPMFAVRPEYIDAAFNALDQVYGNIEAYFQQALGLSKADIKQLKLKYLHR